MLLAEAGTGIGKTLGLSRAGLAVGRAVAAARCGSRPSPRRCSASSTREGPQAVRRPRGARAQDRHPQGPRELSLPAQPRGRAAGRVRRAAPRSSRSWSGAGRLTPRTATWSAATCPAGCRACSAAPAPTALTDRRGECVYAGCPHYRRCFIERAERASREADIVIANHALVMVNAARGREDAPGRIVFDEGHHLFDAADSTFAVAFGGQEAIEMRRWIVGPEGRSRGRRRGLAARLMDVASYDEEGARALDAAVEAARALPSDGWLQRLVEGAPFGPVEALLAEVRGTVYARAKAQEAGYGLETELAEPDGALVSSAAAAVEALGSAAQAAGGAGAAARSGARGRARLARRAGAGAGRRRDPRPVVAARDAGGLDRAARRGSAATADPEFVDWLAVERVEGREYDVAIHRHWLDPTKPLAGGGARAGARRAGHLGDVARRRGLGRGRGAHRRAASARRRPSISRPRARSIMPAAPKC